MSEQRTPRIFAKGMTIKQKNFGNKNKISMGINVEKFTQFLHENVNDKGYVNLQAWSLDEIGKYGETHTATIDNWEPKAKEGGNWGSGGDDSGLPF